MRNIVIYAAALVALLGCKTPTQFVVYVDSNLEPGTELTEIRIRTGPAGSPLPPTMDPQREVLFIPVATGTPTTPRARLPLSFSMIPDGPLPRAARIEATGVLADSRTVVRTVESEYREGQALGLILRLDEICVDFACEPGFTCDAGVCVDNFVAGVPVDDIRPPPRDASSDSSAPDTGRPDTGADTGGSTMCTPGAERSCGNCGTQTCDDAGRWGMCGDQGACMPDAVEPCAAAASRICSDTCEWSECRACEPAETRACGNCGTQTCDGAGWGSCEDEGVCAPGSSVACALGGNRTCSASCMLQPCDVAAALSFADGDEVNLPFTSAVEITDFTLEVWVRTRILLPTESREFLFLPTGVGAALDHDSGYGFGVGSFGDGSRLYVSTDGYTVPFNRLPVVPDNAWHHVAVSRDGGSVTAFVDGTASSTLRFDGAASIRTESLFFGGVEELPPETGLRRFFQGELHSARIWSVARTAAEIRTSMTTAGRIADRDGLLVELLFNEGSGQTVTNTVNGDVGTRGKTNAAESIDPSWISR